MLPEQPALPPLGHPVIPSGCLIHLSCTSVTQPDKWGVDYFLSHTAQNATLAPDNPECLGGGGLFSEHPKGGACLNSLLPPGGRASLLKSLPVADYLT